MAFDVTSFKVGNPFGGARPSNFLVKVIPPPGLGLGAQAGLGALAFSFRCRTSQLPGRTISTSEVPYMGRLIKLNGAPTYEDWETTIYEDEDFSVHELIIQWMDRINGGVTNRMFAGATAIGGGITGYFGTMTVTVASKTGVPIRECIIQNAWPTVLGPAELDWANNDEILNFPVTWALSNWTWDGDPLRKVVAGASNPKVAAPALGAIASATFDEGS